MRDAYWTLLGYFNSLRVLGGALLQVRDDVVISKSLLSTQQQADMTDGSRTEHSCRQLR